VFNACMVYLTTCDTEYNFFFKENNVLTECNYIDRVIVNVCMVYVTTSDMECSFFFMENYVLTECN